MGPDAVHGCIVGLETVKQIGTTEATLRQEIERLRQAEEARALLMQAAAHELRGPLISLLMGLQLAMRRDLDEPARDALKAAHAHAERLERFASDLINVGRTEVLCLDPGSSPVDLQGVLAEAVSCFDVPARVKDLDVRCEVHGDVQAKGDPRRLVQVAGNLLNNAIRFTPRGGRIVLTAWSEDGEACFSVADTGPGIPEARMDELFRPFRQLHRTTVDAGSGLGLFICRNIVVAHGGTITAGNDGGAVFTVRLPRAA